MSHTSTLIVELARGYNVGVSPLNLTLGETPRSDNYIAQDQTLVPRPKLSTATGDNNAPQPIVDRVLGGFSLVNVSGTEFPLISGTTTLAWYDRIWSLASYVSAYGLSDPPTGGNTDYWDWTQIYDANSDQNVAVGCNMSRQSLYVWASESGVFSTLTGAPGARCVAAVDNYLLAGNTREAGVDLVQRVRWCDRGSISSWTGGTSGFEDLLAARGELRRMIPLENRVVLLFDDETWTGTPVEFPFTFRFAPLDTGVGCPYPWTATNTPRGVLFMARDYQVYLIPKEGGPPQPIGQPLQRTIIDTILQPDRAFGVRDAERNQYQFYYSAGGDETLPQRAAYLALDSGAWFPQSFHTNSIELTRGFLTRHGASLGTTWNDYNDSTGSTWDSLSATWDEFQGIGDQRPTVMLGSSRGTMFRLNSNATRDGTTAVLAYWQSAPLETGAATQQKTITHIALDYSATSQSSLSIRASADQGATFQAGSAVTLAALATRSAISQAIAYPYVPARYPVVRVESEDHFYRLHRLHVTARVGGR